MWEYLIVRLTVLIIFGFGTLLITCWLMRQAQMHDKELYKLPINSS